MISYIESSDDDEYDDFNSIQYNTKIINISMKNLDFLPNLLLFTNLQTLYCTNNNLTTLPSLPITLKILYCSDNNLTSLPDLPINLRTLQCESNKLISLPTLPSNLKSLYCTNNNLTTLPSLPITLKILYCSDNNLTSLPDLPTNLQNLQCESNNLKKIPSINNIDLSSLLCSNNKLTILPELPNSLVTLYCSNNNLTSLPFLHDRLYLLNNDNNHISNIVYNTKISIHKKNINTLYKFKYMFYSLKYKNKFRMWMWNIIEKNTIKKSNDKINELIENLLIRAIEIIF